jgi:hypothetical protein
MTSKERTSLDNTLCVAFDVEATGCVVGVHNIVSVGVSTWDSRTNVVKPRLAMNLLVHWWSETSDGRIVQLGDFERECVVGFWKKLPAEAVRDMKTNPQTRLQAATQLATLLDTLQRDYQGMRIVLLSDNPSFDIGWLDSLLGTLGRRPIRFGPKREYREVIDTDSLLIGFPLVVQESIEAEARASVRGLAHLPWVDASIICHTFVLAMRYLASQAAKTALDTGTVFI